MTMKDKTTPKKKQVKGRKVPGRKYTVSKGKAKSKNPGGLTGQAGKAAKNLRKSIKKRNT